LRRRPGFELRESQLDWLLALAFSGPALAAVVIEALRTGGVAAGCRAPCLCSSPAA